MKKPRLVSGSDGTLFSMRCSSFCVLGIATFLAASASRPSAQCLHTSSESAQVVLVKLSPPIYPRIAIAARITGEVVLNLAIRADGTIETAAVASGHPMLKEAAMGSAQQSRFECRVCSGVIRYQLIYSFQLAGTDALTPKAGPEVIQSENRITITANPLPLHIQFSNVSVRSAKCLYLWKCGYRWGGEDYYSYRVRSARCLYLWPCALRRREGQMRAEYN